MNEIYYVIIMKRVCSDFRIFIPISEVQNSTAIYSMCNVSVLNVTFSQ